MKTNMGTTDRLIRFILALAIIVLYFTQAISINVAIVLGIIAGALIITSLVGFCPGYYPFKISTKAASSNRPKKSEELKQSKQKTTQKEATHHH